MTVNTSKTKVMLFRKGSRQKKGEEWKYKGEKIEAVNSYKYLGFNFMVGNNYAHHLKIIARKLKRATNAVWGRTKRAKIETLSKRLYLMEAIIRAGCLYGAEIWGWGKREEIEKVQKRYTKMSMGLSMNTPDCIWQMEAGTRSLEIDMKKRAASYIINILKMEESRWPKLCLKEELRE